MNRSPTELELKEWGKFLNEVWETKDPKLLPQIYLIQICIDHGFWLDLNSPSKLLLSSREAKEKYETVHSLKCVAKDWEVME